MSDITCAHCGRTIVNDPKEGWIDPEAGYDDENGDGMWRTTCDQHDTLTAEHEPGVNLTLEIENHYDSGKVTTHKTVTVPVMPAEGTPEREDWEYDYIYQVTGTGQTTGDSAYFVKVTASSDTDNVPVGTEFEFGL